MLLHIIKRRHKKKMQYCCLSDADRIVFLGSFHSLDLETLHTCPCWLIRTIQGPEILQGWFFSPVLSSLSLLHPYKIIQLYTVSQVSKKDGLESGNTFRDSPCTNKIMFNLTLTWIFQCHQSQPMPMHHIWCWHEVDMKIYSCLMCLLSMIIIFIYKIWTAEKKSERENGGIHELPNPAANSEPQWSFTDCIFHTGIFSRQWKKASRGFRHYKSLPGAEGIERLLDWNLLESFMSFMKSLAWLIIRMPVPPCSKI